MSTEPQEPRRWPFSEGAGVGDAPTSFRAALERKKARASAQGTYKEHARLNRLIVGGRAHTKQHGLS